LSEIQENTVLEPYHPTPGIRALVLSERGRASHEIVSLLEGRGARVTERPLDGNAVRFAAWMQPRLVVMEHADGCAWERLAGAVRRECAQAQVVLVTWAGCEACAVAALRAGAHDYLALPAPPDALKQAVERWIPRPVNVATDAASMVGESAGMMRIRSYMTRAAATDCTVLITGETGTGKELAAEYIHEHSARRDKPFVCINCAAIPDPLLESELFGHTRGAFTGADDLRDGLLASGEGGTVLLDEIGDMSLTAQAKILRVLEKKEVSRLGGTQRRRIDVRFLAATNQDLEAMSSRGTFRRDLYYRLNVARVELPPLRHRREDIPLLIDHYRNRLGGPGAVEFSPECLRRLLNYEWPGNVRELKNVLEGVFLAENHGWVNSDDLPQRLRDCLSENSDLSREERERVVRALCAVHWNKSRAAERLQWSRMTLYRKMAKYQIPHEAGVETSGGDNGKS
jgi:DNA-binding NtrC family response regulator